MLNITIPAYNESSILGDNITELMLFLQEQPYRDEVFVVIANNGSRDNTAQVAGELKRRFGDRVIHHYTPIKGKGNAIRESWLKYQAEYCMFTDADLPFDLCHLNDMIQKFKENNLVIGSRTHKQSKIKRTLMRAILSRGYNFGLDILFRKRFSDAQTGFKGAKRADIIPILKQTRSNGLFLDTELLVLAQMQDFRIGEIPMRGRERRLSSRLNILKSVPYFASRAIALFCVVHAKRVARLFDLGMRPYPVLVIVNGPPGSGKSTLASALQSKFTLPLFRKDDFKELMFEKLGAPQDKSKARDYGKLSFSSLHMVMTQLLQHNNNVILEGNFADEEFGEELRGLSGQFPFKIVQVYLHAPQHILKERFLSRMFDEQRSDGHSVGVDPGSEQHLKQIDWEPGPLNVEDVRLTFDTTDFASISYDSLFAVLKRYLSKSRVSI